ncbi:MAG: site-2 protease family protein [Candidatus Neomarinimicrobiota bacterium]|nr:MAG: site-2 protease family protein [Candidatus Neomarinimicrobiota bacterium]
MGIINQDPAVQVILLPIIIFALSFHEYAHGWMAYRFGDPTAYHAGRLTLNPLAHLDPFGALVLYLVGFGWAKPVPVDPRYLQDPRRDMMWIALAGPASNFFLAFVSGILMVVTLYLLPSPSDLLLAVLQLSLYINLALAVFNFLPIPPLDGSRILTGLVSLRHRETLYTLEVYGPRVLLGVILLGMLTGFNVLGMIMYPVIRFFANVFTFGLVF